MSVARTNHKTNTVLGNGEVYIDLYENGAKTGERYLGDSVGATLSVSSERTTIQSGDGAVAQDLVDVVRSVSRTLGFTLRDSSIANWALFLIGEEDSESIAAAVVKGNAAWAFKAKKGRWFQIGSTDANPSGVGKVSDEPADTKTAGAHDAGDNSVIVTSAAAAASSGNTIARASNYQVDAETGRIYIEPGAADFTDGTTYYVHYKPSAARKIAQAKGTGTASQITCALRYLEDDPAAAEAAVTGLGGKAGRNVYIAKCNLVPGGEAALKSRDTEQQMAFTATVQAPGGSIPAIVIDGAEV